MYLFLIYIYDDVSPCVVSFLSLYTCFLYVYNLLFLFHTKMPWWVLLKVFQKNRLSKSIMPWTLFLQNFSRVCVRIRFYCIQQVIMSLVIYDFYHTSFVCCGSVTGCQRGRLLMTYFYVIGIFFDKMHFTCIWVNLSSFKMIITSGYIENMKITQELLKKNCNLQVSIPPR